MDEALGQTIERADDPLNLSVVMGGCGPGSEIDSLLTLYEQYSLNSRLNVEAYDFNSLAVKIARRGVYRVQNHNPEDVPGEQATTMAKLGFDISQDPALVADGGKATHFMADSTLIRSRHDVTVVEHDLALPLRRERKADLITLYNLLPHLRRTHKLGNAVRNLADVLADRGVFSLSDVLSHEDTEGEMETREILQEEFDLVPLFLSPWQDRPVIFGRI